MQATSFKAPYGDQSLEQRHFFTQKQIAYQDATLALSLRRDRSSHEHLQGDMRLFKELVLELQATPPLGMALDLMALWRQGEQFAPRPLQAADAPLERLLLRLQNECYYRVLRAPQFQRLRELWLALPDTPPPLEASPHTPRALRQEVALSLRQRALVYLMSLLFQPFHHVLVSSFRPHPLPTFAAADPPEWLHAPLRAVEHFEAYTHIGWISEHMNAILGQWLRCQDRQLLPQTAETILRHFALLPNKLERLRWQHLAEVVEGLPNNEDLTRMFALRDAGYRELRVPTRSTSPEGGYHGICQRGPMENLLHSELLFWEDGNNEHFSLRWIEGELLFYEREHSRSFTWQRHLTVVLDVTPGELRFKGAALPASGQAITFGLLARLFLDLRQICPEEVLHFHIHLGPKEAWEQEAALLRLFFRHLPTLGASVQLDLQEKPIDWLSQTPLAMGEMRLLICSQQRWQAHLDAPPSQPPVHHMSLLFSGSDTLQLPNTEEAPPHPHQTLTAQADAHFGFDQPKDAMLALAQLRDHMLEWTLRTSLVPVQQTSRQKRRQP